MDKIRIPILLVTFYLLTYTLSSLLPLHYAISLALFSLSPIVVMWMVYKVLKDGKESEFTFEEVFYEDHPYRRVKDSSKRN
jgi:hypothetical protein